MFTSGSLFEFVSPPSGLGGFGFLLSRKPHHPLLKPPHFRSLRAVEHPSSPDGFRFDCQGYECDQQHQQPHAESNSEPSHQSRRLLIFR
jgi:hypothetical protein